MLGTILGCICNVWTFVFQVLLAQWEVSSWPYFPVVMSCSTSSESMSRTMVSITPINACHRIYFEVLPLSRCRLSISRLYLAILRYYNNRLQHLVKVTWWLKFISKICKETCLVLLGFLVLSLWSKLLLSPILMQATFNCYHCSSNRIRDAYNYVELHRIFYDVLRSSM